MLASQDAELAHQHFDAAGLEVVAQGPAGWQHDQRPEAIGVKAGSEQVQLTIGSIASARGMQVEDGPRPHGHA